MLDFKFYKIWIHASLYFNLKSEELKILLIVIKLVHDALVQINWKNSSP